MKGLATVQMLKQIEQGTGKRIHELFDLICGTSTGGMLAIALTVKQMTLDQCEEIYKKLGKEYFHKVLMLMVYMFLSQILGLLLMVMILLHRKTGVY